MRMLHISNAVKLKELHKRLAFWDVIIKFWHTN